VSERDNDVNGIYSDVNIIEEFLKPKSMAKLILVAEKLQTGKLHVTIKFFKNSKFSLVFRYKKNYF
jgi:hypothetical protein